jgi:hypothetical protein
VGEPFVDADDIADVAAAVLTEDDSPTARRPDTQAPGRRPDM